MVAITFIGQTGSGKTTLARSVAEELGVTHISSGDIARKMAESDAYVRAELGRGEMAPELAMREEVVLRIEAATASTGDFVIEGFPRRLEQLYILESQPGIQPLYFVLECDQLLCLRRLVQRGREYDHPDAVAARFRFYQEYTEPMEMALVRHTVNLNASLGIDVLTEQVVSEYRMEKTRANGAAVDSYRS